MIRGTTNPWKYLKRIEYNGENARLQHMEYPSYPDNCWTLDTNNRTSTFIRFVFNQDTAFSAEIFIEDKLLSLKRADAFAKFSYNGPLIVNSDQKYKGYALEIDQEIFDERDKKVGCKNYPNANFSSYYDCDQAFIQNWMAEHMSDLSPIWASKSENNVTIQKSNVDVKQFGSYIDMCIGLLRSKCPQPCKATRISSRYTNKVEMEERGEGVFFHHQHYFHHYHFIGFTILMI